MRLGGGPQQFGVDAERCRRCSQALVRPDLECLGFHVFAGSQNLRAEMPVPSPAPRPVDLVLRLADGRRPGALPQPRRRLRHPVLRDDQPLDLPAVAANLAELLTTRLRPRCPTPVVLELAATSSASAASTSPASSTARSRAARRLLSSTVACTTSSPLR
jgi:diaminopimelate decarboxylase